MPVNTVLGHWPPFFNHAGAMIHSSPIVFDKFIGILFAQYTFGNQLFGINLTWYRMLFNLLIHHRLRSIWLIRLVVAVTAITNQINYYIALKFVTEIKRQLGNK